MKSSTRESEHLLAKYFNQKTRHKLADSFDPTVLMVLVWSLALTAMGYYTNANQNDFNWNNSQQWRSAMVSKLPVLDSAPAECATLELPAEVAKPTIPIVEIKPPVAVKAVVKVVEKKTATTTISTIPQPKLVSNTYRPRPVYTSARVTATTVVSSAKVTIVSAPTERKVVIRETDRLATKEKLAYVVEEEIIPLQRQAANTGKLVLLSFGAKWCLPCKQMEKNTFPDPQVQTLLQQNYVWKKINVQDISGYSLQEYYDVKLVPTTLVLNSDGEILGRFAQALTALQLTAILGEYAKPEYNNVHKLVSPSISKVTILESEALEMLVSVKAGLAAKNRATY